MMTSFSIGAVRSLSEPQHASAPGAILAPYYDLEFPINAKLPSESQISRIEGLLTC
jgi:hypothetical protein